MLLGIQHKRVITMAQGPLGYYPYRQAVITWTMHPGGDNQSHVASNDGRYRVYLNPLIQHDAALDAAGNLTDDLGVLDSMLTAIQYDCQVGAFISHDLAVIAWDRQSHNCRPAVTLDPDGWVTFYWDVPSDIWSNFRRIPIAPSREVDRIFRDPGHNRPGEAQEHGRPRPADVPRPRQHVQHHRPGRGGRPRAHLGAPVQDKSKPG